VPLADGSDTEICNWLDDHSRYCLASTAARVFTAMVAAMASASADVDVPCALTVPRKCCADGRSNGGRTWCDEAAWTREDTMTYDEPVDRRAVVPSRELLLALPDRRPARLAAAARTLARARPARVARILTAGPLLGASAIAVVAAATGKAIQLVTGAVRPTTAEPSQQQVRHGAWPPTAGSDVQVTWTSVEIRWTSARWPGVPRS